MDKENQLKRGATGRRCHAWVPTVLIRLLALQICIACTCATPTPPQYRLLERELALEEVTVGSERLQQPGSLAYEHFHTENNYGQHTHVSDEAVIGRNVTDRRTTGRRPCDWSNGQNTTQLMPHYNCISKCIDQWQHHKPYTDHLLDEYNFAAGKAFVYCHKGSVSLLHTQMHSNPSSAGKLSQDSKERYARGLALQNNEPASSFKAAPKPSSRTGLQRNLLYEAGLESQHYNVSGAPMAESIVNADAHYEKVVFSGFAIKTLGAQHNLDSCRKFFLAQAELHSPNINMDLPC